jgi:hypothetical protein
MEEHQRRRGDPTAGGSARAPIMTAYRQDALACAAAMVDGPKRPRDLKAVSPRAASILLHNYYGWFARAERGVYALTEVGRATVHAMVEGSLQGSSHVAGRLGMNIGA